MRAPGPTAPAAAVVGSDPRGGPVTLPCELRSGMFFSGPLLHLKGTMTGLSIVGSTHAGRRQ